MFTVTCVIAGDCQLLEKQWPPSVQPEHCILRKVLETAGQLG